MVGFAAHHLEIIFFFAFTFLLVAIPLLETFLQTLNHDFKSCLHVLICVLY